jgi:hypothetical protein
MLHVDLQKLNAGLLAMSGTGGMNDNEDAVSAFCRALPVCVALPKGRPEEWEWRVYGPPAQAILLHQTPEDLIQANERYLDFARRVATFVVCGSYDGLVVMHMTYAQAKLLARLSDSDIATLARTWGGAIYDVDKGLPDVLRSATPRTAGYLAGAMVLSGRQ